PLRLARVTGARGVGKTVLLTSLGHRAAEQGWVVVSETATPGLVGRLIRALEAWRRRIAAEPRRKIRAVVLPSVLGIGGGGLTFDDTAGAAGGQGPDGGLDLRHAAGALLDLLDEHSTGLLITL